MSKANIWAICNTHTQLQLELPTTPTTDTQFQSSRTPIHVYSDLHCYLGTIEVVVTYTSANHPCVDYWKLTTALRKAGMLDLEATLLCDASGITLTRMGNHGYTALPPVHIDELEVVDYN